jgi:hypothetical protein
MIIRQKAVFRTVFPSSDLGKLQDVARGPVRPEDQSWARDLLVCDCCPIWVPRLRKRQVRHPGRSPCQRVGAWLALGLRAVNAGVGELQ